MKTSSEIYEEIYDHFIWPEVATGTDYEAIKIIIADFEKEVRKEQDKITRHACAENVLKVEEEDLDYYLNSNTAVYNLTISGDCLIKKNTVHSVIINTKLA